MSYNSAKFLIPIFVLAMNLNGFAQVDPLLTDSSGLDIHEEITIAYGEQTRKDVSSSITTISGDELSTQTVLSLSNALYGRMPGLMIQQRGNEPGNDSPDLHMRGVSTFGGAGVAPIIIVDGVESTFDHLSPHEIESISLLKDAAASAVFGNRGANGVILVTTKRGSPGPLKINFSAQGGFQQGTRLPDFLNSYGYAKLYNEGLVNDKGIPAYTEEELQKYQTGSDPYLYSDVNWYDEILRSSAPISQYNLNFNGGDSTVKYFASLSALSNGGLYQKTGDLSENSLNAKYDRYNVRANVDIQLSNYISASMNLGGSVGAKSTPGGNTTENIFNRMSILPPNMFPVYNEDGSYGGNSLYTNPLGDILESGFYTASDRIFQSSFKVDGDLGMITPGLSVSSALSYHTSFTSYSNKTRQYERFDKTVDENGRIVYNKFGQNTQLVGNEGESDQWQNLTMQAFLRYEKSLEEHQLTALVIYNYKNFTIIGPSEYYPDDGSVFPFENIGIGGRLSNIYKKKYIGEFSFGYNGSENFAKGHRFGFFPAASVGWILSEENFFNWGNDIDFLKLKASYGIIGNENVGGERFLFEPRYPLSNGYFFGGSNTYEGGIVQGRPANPSFTWEKEKKFNFGVEAVVGGQLNFAVEYFYHNRYDILVPAYSEVPAFLGKEYPYLNLGEVQNQGVDAVIGFASKESKGVTYHVNTNFWFAKNIINYNAELPQREAYLLRAGRAINQPFLLEAIGFFADENDIANSPNQVFTEVQPGDIKYKDQNGDGIIDNADFFPAGNGDVPTFNLGVNAGVALKGFYVDAMIQAVTGRSVYLGGSYYHAFQNDSKVSTMALGRWREGNTEGATYPRLSASNNENNYQPSTFWQKDGSFIKLRNLEFGYFLPDTFTSKLGMEKAQVFINGSNLFSLDYLEYSDPETLTGYPSLRTISMGASIQF